MEQVGNQVAMKIGGWNRDEDLHADHCFVQQGLENFDAKMNFGQGMDVVDLSFQGVPDCRDVVLRVAAKPDPDDKGKTMKCRKKSGDISSTEPGWESWGSSGQEEAVSLMQKGQRSKRHRSPTPRRRRIPFKARPRDVHGSSDRRGSGSRAPSRPSTGESRPTSTSSWAVPPWRRHGRGAAHRDRVPNKENEEECEEVEVEVVNDTARPSDWAPTPVFDDGIRTWGELTGILDPMDEPEQLIDQAIVNNSVERMNNMQPQERQRLALDLVRFMALMFAEALRMMSLANLAENEAGDTTSLLQGQVTESLDKKGHAYESIRTQGRDRHNAEYNKFDEYDMIVNYESDAETNAMIIGGNDVPFIRTLWYPRGHRGRTVNVMLSQVVGKVKDIAGSRHGNEEGDVAFLMQTNVDKFGSLLQKLLSLLEKLDGKVASSSANFLNSMLIDAQRPGPHINAAVIEKMDRLQALLLSFDGAGEAEMTEGDHEWCLKDRDHKSPFFTMVPHGR